MIKKVKVQVFVEHLMCDKCEAEMEQMDYVCMTMPPIYGYECPKCKNTFSARVSYPREVQETDEN